MLAFRSLLLVMLVVPASYAQSITVDPTFGTDGFVLETFGADRAAATAVERLPDGRLVVLGSRAGGDLLAARYLPDGTLDPSFGGGDGWVSLAQPRDPAADGDAARPGSFVLRGGSGNGFYLLSQGVTTLARVTPDGMLDPSFGEGGVMTIDDPRLFRIYDIAEASDGTVWVTGYGNAPANTIRFILVKLTPNGQLDTSYGDGGVAFFGDVNALSKRLLIQPDGRLVLAGNLYASSTSGGVAAARFTADGAPDPTFGTDGFFSAADFGGTEAVALQPDGRLVLAGQIQFGSTTDFYIARLTADGQLDSSFDGDGSRLFSVGNFDAFNQVTVLPDGRLLAGGSVHINRSDAAFALMNPDGSPVTEFGPEGVNTFFFGPSASWFSPIWDFVVLPDGRVVAVGSPGQHGTLQVHGVTRLDLGLSFNGGDEVLDPDFGDGGLVEADLGGDDAADVTLELPDGGLLTIGTSITGALPNVEYSIGCIRTLADGSLDPAYGLDGRVRIVLGGDSLAVNGAVRLPDGRVVVVGSEVVGGIRYVLLIRFTADGALDPAFGTGGVVRYTYQGIRDSGEAVVVTPDGRLLVLVVLGTSLDPNDDRVALVRFTVDGALDGTFGTGGVGALSPLIDASDLVLLPDGRVVAGGAAPGGFALVRFAPDGTLDPTFGTDGTSIVDLSGTASLHALVRLIDGQLAAAGTVSFSGDSDGFLTRFLADGTLDPSFGTDGVAFVSFENGGSTFDTLTDLAVLGDGRYLAVGYSDGRDVGDLFSFASVFTAAGVPDTNFGDEGTLALDLSPANDLALGVRLLESGGALLTGSTGYSGAKDFVLAKFDPGEVEVASESVGPLPVFRVSAYPNPVQDRVSIGFTLRAAGDVTAEVFDLLGRRVALLTRGTRPAGTHTTHWDVQDAPSGTYIVRVTTPAGTATRRLTVVR